MRISKFVSLLVLLSLTGCFDYSDGDRAGVITKFSHKGLMCKTWEGSMNLGGMRKERKAAGTDEDGDTQYIDTMVPNTFDFTVEDLSLLPQIEAAMESGKRVQLHYRQEMFTLCRSDSNYFITAVH